MRIVPRNYVRTDILLTNQTRVQPTQEVYIPCACARARARACFRAPLPLPCRRLRHSHLLRGLEGRVDGAELDVAVDDLAAALVALDVGRHARRRLASAAADAGRRRVLVGRVAAVEPEHVGVVL